MKTGNRNTAQRIVNANNGFIGNLMEISGCSKSEAERVLSLYKKLKLVKMDAVNGVLSVKHGAYMDLETIQRAIEQTK